ncbi:Retrovirus-related Pol polyprotein from type-2 retrotransposable element R2DM [Varanus komodoensis]|nr:Retrovirus-related Pol polyprotein from type-2 retrotransposable element R2DM [Varanus komodoensis]
MGIEITQHISVGVAHVIKTAPSRHKREITSRLGETLEFPEVKKNLKEKLLSRKNPQKLSQVIRKHNDDDGEQEIMMMKHSNKQLVQNTWKNRQINWQQKIHAYITRDFQEALYLQGKGTCKNHFHFFPFVQSPVFSCTSSDIACFNSPPRNQWILRSYVTNKDICNHQTIWKKKTLAYLKKEQFTNAQVTAERCGSATPSRGSCYQRISSYVLVARIRIARRDKNAFLNEQCKEIEENNRIGRTRDLFKKIGDMKGMFHAKMGMIKDQNGRDLTEAEEIKKRWQDYTEELYKKELNVPDNHDGVATNLKPDILECEVKWALGSLSNNKASGGDSIPAELFKILKDDAKNIYFCFIDYAKAFDCVDHNKLWQVLKEMGVPDHLICLLRNPYAGQETRVRTGHGTTDRFKTEKGVQQGCILLPCLFNFYAEHIMRKVGLDESPVGIKIAGRNINNLKYADDTTQMAESEEELKSLLMQVKEESAKVGLKLNIKKTKIMASGPLTSWKIDGEEMEITADRDCSQEIKRRLLLGRKAMAHLDSILKSRDITLPTKGQILKMKLKYFGHLMRRKDSLEKSLMLGAIEGKRRGRQRMRWLDAVTEAVVGFKCSRSSCSLGWDGMGYCAKKSGGGRPYGMWAGPPRLVQAGGCAWRHRGNGMSGGGGGGSSSSSGDRTSSREDC